MNREEVFAYTAGCYNGEPASCSYACPFRLDLRSFLKKAARGRWDAAYKELQSAVLFPSVAAALCPRPCEDACQRYTVLGSDPVAVGRLESACLSFAGKKDPTAYPIPPKNERVAVVGAGPAGLSAALLLAQKQFQVTVFDQQESRGGELRPHPDFAGFDEDFSLAFSAVNVAFQFGVRINALSELREFDAILLATGAAGEHFGLLDAWDSDTCATADPRVFLTGRLTGLPLMEGMALGVKAVRSAEAFLQSGNLYPMTDDWDNSKSKRYPPHGNEADLPGVVPAGEAYTKEEAQKEAERCMLCDCTACMETCELLIRYRKKPPRIGNDVFMDGQSRNSVSSASITRQTWSCNLCGNCGTKCAEGVDLRGLFQLSRSARVESGYYPPAIHDAWLRDMDFAAGEASFTSAIAGQDRCEYAFFPGCRLGASNPAWVTRSASFLAEKRKAGVILNCCGAPAYWAGDDETFRRHHEELQTIWHNLGKPTLVTACVTCEKMFTQFLPDIPYVSLYEMLSKDAFPTGARTPIERAAVFDPCAAAGKAPVKDAVRRLAADCGIAVTDYQSGGKCCGFGGHMQLANPLLYDSITKNRVEESSDPFIVYCANCRDVFLSQGKECFHILDLVYGLPSQAVPTLEEKRIHRLVVKKELAAIYEKVFIEPEEKPWDRLPVSVLPEVQQKMEGLLISLSHIREAIWRAEEAGEGFINENGEYLCYHEKNTLTYWVLYRKEPGSDGEPQIMVRDAYYHRMRQRGER